MFLIHEGFGRYFLTPQLEVEGSYLDSSGFYVVPFSWKEGKILYKINSHNLSQDQSMMIAFKTTMECAKLLNTFLRVNGLMSTRPFMIWIEPRSATEVLVYTAYFDNTNPDCYVYQTLETDLTVLFFSLTLSTLEKELKAG